MKWPFPKKAEVTEQEREEGRVDKLRALLDQRRRELLEQTLREAARDDG